MISSSLSRKYFVFSSSSCSSQSFFTTWLDQNIFTFSQNTGLDFNSFANLSLERKWIAAQMSWSRFRRRHSLSLISVVRLNTSSQIFSKMSCLNSWFSFKENGSLFKILNCLINDDFPTPASPRTKIFIVDLST